MEKIVRQVLVGLQAMRSEHLRWRCPARTTSALAAQPLRVADRAPYGAWAALPLHGADLSAHLAFGRLQYAGRTPRHLALRSWQKARLAWENSSTTWYWGTPEHHLALGSWQKARLAMVAPPPGAELRLFDRGPKII